MHGSLRSPTSSCNPAAVHTSNFGTHGCLHGAGGGREGGMGGRVTSGGLATMGTARGVSGCPG